MASSTPSLYSAESRWREEKATNKRPRGRRNFDGGRRPTSLPNHVAGRGITKKLKELYPDAQILPLDYDPDVAHANIENRLQMLIMDAKAKHEE